MLHRSFKPAKCKTALKLAASRIKLLKNKRDAQIKHLKRELAQLLESGQEQTARIRVEHVVREEKTMAAYDLVEIYCELIVARLPIIESQKNCPIDLKEAITSVIFAAPRCADIPELMDVRKHFTAKYGKEFISAALELRPDCGVSRILVEKLSAKAPDGQTKIKILTAIAEEHNVKWDPNSFGGQDAMPPEDLLNGPNTFETASRINVEPPSVQVPPNHDQRHDAPVNLGHNVRSAPSSQSFASADVSASKTTMSGTPHSEVRPSGTGSEGMEFRHSYSGNGNTFPSNGQNWNMDFKDATSAAQAAAEAAERASMAARAAAELSSHGKITRQYSTESKSSFYGLRDEGPGKYAGSTPHGEHLGKNSVNNSFHDRNPRTQNERIVGQEQDNLAGVAERRYTNSHSKKSSQAASPDDDTSVNSLQKAGGYSQKSSSEVEAIKPENSDLFSEGFTKKQSNESAEEFSSEMQDGMEPEDIDSLGGERFRKQSSGVFSQSHSRTFGEGGMMEQSSESEEEFSSEMQYGMKTENVDYFGEQRFRKQSSGVSSRSHTFNHDDYDVVSNSNRQKFGNDAGEDPMVGMDRENIQTDTRQTESHGAATVLFDESGSDGDDSRFDVEGDRNRRESNLYFTSPDRKSPTHLSANTNPWSSRQTMSESLGKSIQQSLFSTEGHSSSEFSESLTKSAVPSQPDGLVPVTFDDSDGPSSESEEEMNKSKLGGTTNHSIFSHKENAYFGNPEPTRSESNWFTESSYAEETNSGSNRKPWLHSSSDVSDSVELHPDKNQGAEFNVGSQKKSGFDLLSTHQSQMDSNDMIGKSLESSFDEGKPGQSMQYSRHSLLHEGKDNIDATESPDTVKDTEFLTQSTLESGKELSLGMLTGGLRNKGLRRPPYTRNPPSDALSSSKQAAENTPTGIEQSTAAPPVKTSVSSESYDQKASTKVDKKSRPSARVTYFDSNNDDSDEELPQQTFRSNREPYEQKAGIKINNKSSRSPTTFFDSDNGDSEEDLPKQNLSSKGRLGSGFSRRTKAASSSSEKSSYSNSKGTAASEVSVTSDHGMERKPSRSSYATETPPTARSQTRGNGRRESSELPRSAERASSEPMPESKFSLREESIKSSAIEQPSSPLRKVASGSTESSSRDTPSRESSLKKASHVHPKLPDYDTLAAQFESLRSNRK